VSAGIEPPPIGEALTVGWETFQKNPVPILVGTLCAIVVSLIPIVGGGLAFAGMMAVALKALRGQVPEAADGFVGLTRRPVDHIVMGLLQIVGLLACCVGMYVTHGLFFQGTLLILDRDLSWEQAKDVCMRDVKPNLVSWTLYALVLGLVGGAGMILCIVGVFVTAPVAMIGFAYAYEKTYGAVPPAA
jgi:uncharacterized membrane protein